MARLSLFFNRFRWLPCLGLIALWSLDSGAINIHALYTASCKREIGIILDVGERQIMILTFSGKIVPVERYEVIYHATYPLDIVPVNRVENPEAVPLVEIQTLQGDSLVTLVKGWPVDFSQDKVAFLSLKGSELVVDRSRIWKISSQRELKDVEFQSRPTARYEFAHPPVFSDCPLSTPRNAREHVVQVVPQQVLSDTIAIKREMDRLRDGHRLMSKYERDQQFYPQPEVYANQTSLGIWLMSEARYGASSNRKNNFTPFLVNQHSSGPFGFQSEFRSGSGPIPSSIHEETQTQVYYRFKADYFHFSALVDPNLLLVGSKYKWQPQDLWNKDARAVESASIEMGFDYGRLSLEFFSGASTDVAVRLGDRFDQSNLGVGKLGLRLYGLKWYLQLISGGSSSYEAYAFHVHRLNFNYRPSANWEFLWSGIHRDLKYDGIHVSGNYDDFVFESTSLTAAAYIQYRWRGRYWLGAMGAVEKLDHSFGLTSASTSESAVLPKVGAMISLSF